ncbi:MAG: DNA excision repair protein ERCC-3 [Planctomycetota bacterium]|jgi:DNA excision repair protein ERCC-3
MLQTVRALVDERGRQVKDEAGQPLTEEHPRYAQARDALSYFAELEKSPNYLHTYRVTSVSVWNAAALGLTAADIEETLDEFACIPVPDSVREEIRQWVERYGILRIERQEQEGEEARFQLVAKDPEVLSDVLGYRDVARLTEVGKDGRVWISGLNRGSIKQALIKIGFPVDDQGGYLQGDHLAIGMRDVTLAGKKFAVRHYQQEAADAFFVGGSVVGGNGVVALPCGAGKTVVAMRVMSMVQTKTLILTTNTVAVRQWHQELLDKTELTEEQVGEYTGDGKTVRPVTISTYQMLTWRPSKSGEFKHLGLFSQENWGLVIYDEVHLLPAPVFRATAGLQARRRLGLTATLIREDGKQDEVFCLIGPKRYDVPWKVLEGQGFIAPATCIEVRVPLEASHKSQYRSAGARGKFRIASENPAKLGVVRELLGKHPNGRLLVIGQYIEQLELMSKALKAPLITGKTPNDERERLYEAFRNGEESLLVVSKVGNFAIDLPDANVAIQISGTFGSRQEEAQRLGRILRPKSDGAEAVFYSVVTADSRDQEFAEKRQLFLTEQGYSYQIIESHRLRQSTPTGGSN